MSRIVFYRHERADRGVRTGVEVNGVALFESFCEATDGHDPALLWYIDLTFEGDALPEETELVRQWLLENTERIRTTLLDVRNSISAGFDPELRPFHRQFGDWANGVHLSISASAVDRTEARRIGQQLETIADDWKKIVMEVEPLVSA